MKVLGISETHFRLRLVQFFDNLNVCRCLYDDILSEVISVSMYFYFSDTGLMSKQLVSVIQRKE